jgi:hypothetical protein
MRRSFAARAAWCPTCHAAPNRKCQPTAADRDLAERLADAGVKGHQFHDHHARWERATMLRQIAEQGASILYRLAVTDGRREPEQARIDTLPLFAQVNP